MNCKNIGVAIILSACLSQTYALTMIGVISCGKWVEGRTSHSIAEVANAYWIDGFLSGLAQGSQTDALKKTDAQSVWLWVDNFCKANPLKDTFDAGNDLHLELLNKK